MSEEELNFFMDEALKEAKNAIEFDEVPIGAVIVRNGEIIARGSNHKERANCATRHAEIEAIEEATKVCENWYLDDCEMVVTLEPCVMCAGAIMNSRLKSVYFGAYDKKAGGFGGLYDFASDKKLNHRINVVGGVRSEECAKLLSDFFKTKRKPKND